MNTYLINREDRPERLADVRQELQDHYLNAHLFPAIIDKPGWKGCAASHIQVLEKCQPNEVIMIMEDDVKFLVDDVQFWIDECMSDLPLGWDILMLGGSPREPQELYTEFLYRARNVVTAHAYIIRNRPKGALQYILSHKDDVKKIDRYYSDIIQMMFGVYLCRPLICVQRQYKSDTCRRSDVSTIITNYARFCK